MSMLRRPLTTLELGDDDIKWISDQWEQKKKAANKGGEKEAKEEPMEVEKKEEDDDRLYKQLSTPVLKITGGPALDDLMTYSMPRTLARNLPVASTPQATPQANMTTPINTDAAPAPPPNIRVTRANARQARMSSNTINPPIFQTPEGVSSSSSNSMAHNTNVRLQMLPETPEINSSDISPTLRSVDSSPTQDLLVNLLSPSTSGPSANTRRSQRH